MFKDQFTMNDFEKKMKKENSAIKYTEAIASWQKSSKEKYKKYGYYDNVKVVASFGVFGIVGLIYCV